jgi:DNA-directed RNA polymerase subunit E'/Rpb7
MFFLVTIHEVVSLPSRDVAIVADSLKTQLSELHVGRVLAGLGVCVRIDKLRAMGDGLVAEAVYVPVLADLIVFRPFVGQVLDAQLVSSDHTGLKGPSSPPLPLSLTFSWRPT